MCYADIYVPVPPAGVSPHAPVPPADVSPQVPVPPADVSPQVPVPSPVGAHGPVNPNIFV